MQRLAAVVAALVAGVWAGVLVCIGAIAAPAAFAVLARQDAGHLVSRMFMVEAYLSLAFAMLLFFIERRRTRDAAEAGTGSHVSANLLLLLVTLFCTVAGYFAIEPMMATARLGQGPWSYGALHAASASLFVLKGLLVLLLAWRLTTGVRLLAIKPSATSTIS